LLRLTKEAGLRICRFTDISNLAKKIESHEGDSLDYQGASTNLIITLRGEGFYPLSVKS
jgi:hypothetical protein